ncbi:MAG TPA: sugar-binding protein, partial [Victivallales bacterium]|nr:sugar-binding protein [Victivallales bacterium]
IKAIDPSAVVISNSVCTGDNYLRKLLELDMLKYCDIVAIHTYNYGNAGANRLPEKWYERMLGVDKMLREFSGGKEVPLFITEMGWPTHIEGSGSTQTDSADFLARLFILAKTLPFLKGIWWYDFRDDGWDFKYNENNFGMVRPDLTPKKSYYVLKDLAPLIKDTTFSERIDAGDPNIWILKFKSPEKKDIIAVWSAYTDNDWAITLKADTEIKSEFSMLCPGEGDIKRLFMQKKGNDIDKKSFSFIVRTRPYLLNGDLSGINSASVKKIDFPETMRPKNRVVVVPEKIGRATPLSEKTSQIYNFGDDKYYRVISENRKGKDDLDASFSIKWEPSFIHVFVTVRDDIFSQTFSGEDTWKGDGIQLAFQPFRDGLANPDEHSDFDIALTENGPIVYGRLASRMSDITNEVEINIDKVNKETSYHIKFPIEIIGLSSPLKSDTILGFSLLVNDNDGKGRKGYLHWGDGIGHGKDPSLYNWITLEK